LGGRLAEIKSELSQGTAWLIAMVFTFRAKKIA